jgi:hypothetical protein
MRATATLATKLRMTDAKPTLSVWRAALFSDLPGDASAMFSVT